MKNALLVLCGLVLLAGCANDDDTQSHTRAGHGRHHRNSDPNASPSPAMSNSAPVNVPPGTVTNSTALHQGAVDAMGTPASGE
jgi:hypothetical protein